MIALGGMAVALLNAQADEGMWLPSLLSKLNNTEMQRLGAKFTDKDIYNLDGVSFKDAVMALDYGSCTGELVSPEGLFLTNHHCGYDEIRKNSSQDHNYLKDGFWANSREEELPNPGKTVSFLVRAEEVSQEILDGLTPGMDEDQKFDSIMTRSVRIEREAQKDTHFEAKVESMFEGNRYYLFVYETFKDVRLVGAPPHFIGKFGGDTDNWMWPRHTGDFTLFRIYTGPDGKPAEYAPENIPMKSKFFFPISLKGYENNDFSMVMGYPGSTNRYLTARGVESLMNSTNDPRITLRNEKLSIIRDFMAESEKATIQYASKHAQSSNYYKFSIGQNKGLEKLKIIEKKRQGEQEFREWIQLDENRLKKYGQVIESIEKAYNDYDLDSKAYSMLSEAFLRGPEIFLFAYRFRSLADELKSNRKFKNEISSTEKLLARVDEHFENYDPSTDQKIVAALTRVFIKEMPSVYYPRFVQDIKQKYKGDCEAWAADLFRRSFINDREKIESFIKNPKRNLLDKDPIFKASEQIFNTYGRARDKSSGQRKVLDQAYQLYLEGLFEMKPEKSFYPDANSTLRMTYGQIGDYEPRDAVHYNYFTTVNGYLEKEKPGDREFDVWPEFRNKVLNRDFGPYADKDGTLHTCFISNNDITGGNSGSPVVNKNGELIGIAFDGNWEAMSGDVAFEPQFQKCINVDIRFVLWVIDHFAGASHIVDEMTLIR